MFKYDLESYNVEVVRKYNNKQIKAVVHKQTQSSQSLPTSGDSVLAYITAWNHKTKKLSCKITWKIPHSM